MRTPHGLGAILAVTKRRGAPRHSRVPRRTRDVRDLGTRRWHRGPIGSAVHRGSLPAPGALRRVRIRSQSIARALVGARVRDLHHEAAVPVFPLSAAGMARSAASISHGGRNRRARGQWWYRRAHRTRRNARTQSVSAIPVPQAAATQLRAAAPPSEGSVGDERETRSVHRRSRVTAPERHPRRKSRERSGLTHPRGRQLQMY
jgi:hypothetical protein